MLKSRISELFLIKYPIIAGALWTVTELLFESKKRILPVKPLRINVSIDRII